MPMLALVRHATNDFVKTGRLPGQSPNIHLNEEGRAQAEALGDALHNRRILAVYSSQLERAIETAWRVSRRTGLPVHIDPRLADTDAGELAGMPTKDIGEDERYKAAWKIIVEKPSEGRLPGGESLVEMQTRVVAALADIARAHPDPKPEESGADQAGAKPDPAHKPEEPGLIVVVAHSDPIKAALAHYLGMPFDNFQLHGVSPASITTIAVDDDNHPRGVLFVNRTPYGR